MFIFKFLACSYPYLFYCTCSPFTSISISLWCFGITGRFLCCGWLGIQDWPFTLHIHAWDNRALSIWPESWCSRICTSPAWWLRVKNFYAVQPGMFVQKLRILWYFAFSMNLTCLNCYWICSLSMRLVIKLREMSVMCDKWGSYHTSLGKVS